jgi:hypothetical protein
MLAHAHVLELEGSLELGVWSFLREAVPRFEVHGETFLPLLRVKWRRGQGRGGVYHSES